MPTENRKNKQSSGAKWSDWMEHEIYNIHPDDERHVLRETRKRAQKLHGFTEEELDHLYGPESRSGS